MLGLVLAAVALAVAVPLRGYLAQRDVLAKAELERQQLEDQVAELQARKAALQDPTYIKAEARRRLQYVSPGETVYRIIAPEVKESAPAGSAGAKPAPPAAPWYGQLWDSLVDPATEPAPDR